ncbi:MAG: hypothetical protein CM15mP120_06430 [Pseudomonadota bacterium]|nr:MAG: hypothetical protein CM15mP120_06430 [Pseudomonadota bacterium]
MRQTLRLLRSGHAGTHRIKTMDANILFVPFLISPRRSSAPHPACQDGNAVLMVKVHRNRKRTVDGHLFTPALVRPSS